MNINHKIGPVLIDGTTGADIAVDSDYKSIQLSFAGRTTGKLAITGKSEGAEDYEPFNPPIVLDLENGEFTAYPFGAISSIRITPSEPGNDLSLTVNQWPAG